MAQWLVYMVYQATAYEVEYHAVSCTHDNDSNNSDVVSLSQMWSVICPITVNVIYAIEFTQW